MKKEAHAPIHFYISILALALSLVSLAKSLDHTGFYAYAENTIIEGLGWLSDDPMGRKLQEQIVLCDNAVVGDNGIRSRDYVSGSAGFAIYYDSTYQKWILEVDGWRTHPLPPTAKDWPCFSIEGMHILIENPVQYSFMSGGRWNNQELALAPWEVQ